MPTFELGYTYEHNNFLFGLLLDYTNDRRKIVVGMVNATAVTKMNNHISPMLMVGMKASKMDVFYLKAGYSGLWGVSNTFR